MNNDITFSTYDVRDTEGTMWERRKLPNPIWGVRHQELGIGSLEEQMFPLRLKEQQTKSEEVEE